MDLYTLTYDSHESLDCHGVLNNDVSTYINHIIFLVRIFNVDDSA